jgi:hypothetical protein
MTDFTKIPMYPQPAGSEINAQTDYKNLAWNVLSGVGQPGENERFMFDKECHVAKKILIWLDEHPHLGYYRDYIKMIPYEGLAHLESTNTLHFNLWMNTNASIWISTRDAKTHTDLLWQFALLRVSCFLNTGHFTA